MRRWVLLAVFVYTVVFSVYSVLRYYDFRTLYFDLGITTHSMNQILQAQEGLETLILPSTPGHVGHFSPIFAPVLALYALVPVPETLLVLQSVLLGVAALPLYDLGLEVLGRRDRAGALAFVYLLYPALHGVNRYDFHIEAFIPLFGFVLLLALVRGQYRLFLVASVLLLVTHEFVSILFFWSGAVLLFYHWRTGRETFDGLVPKRYSETVFLLGAAFLAIAEISNRGLTPSHGSIFDWLGVSTIGAGGPGTPLFLGLPTADPLRVVYWLLLLAPLLFLPLWEWRLALPVVPWIGITALSSVPFFYSIYFQYAAFVIPPLFFAAIWALRRPARFRFLGPDRRALVLLLGTTVILASATSVLSPTNLFDGAFVSSNNLPYPPAVTVHDQATARLLGLIPPQASVLAQNELFTQVSDRRVVSIFWDGSALPGPPDYIAVDLARTWYWTAVPPHVTALSTMVPDLLFNGSHGIVGFSDTTFVYGLGWTAPPALATVLASLPQSPAQAAANWTEVNGSLAYGAQSLSLNPSGSAPAFAETPLPDATNSVLLEADLGPADAPAAGDWSGLILGLPGASPFHLVYLNWTTGQVRYARAEAGRINDTLLGIRPWSGGSVHIQVLLSGGTMQVWVGGFFVAIVYRVGLGPVTAVGLATDGPALTMTSFAAYGSVADRIPPGGDVPWSGIAAFAVVALPVFLILSFEVGVRRILRQVFRRPRRGLGR